MKVLAFTIPKSKRDALILQEDQGIKFYELLHQHEELQISYVKAGAGTLIVGDAINSYGPGDFIVLGSNLPHVFRSDTSKGAQSHMLTVFFTEESFGSGFFEVEELKGLKVFFDKAANGFKVENASPEVVALFEQLQIASPLDRFVAFIQLLQQLNVVVTQPLSTFASRKRYSDNEGNRMSAVYEFTITNFRNDISLDMVSEVASMTKNAFCKYFKQRTNKTYTSFVNELRIEEACHLLRSQPERPVAEIAEVSGFQNMSHFNRRFKGLKGKTPLEYRKAFT